MLNVILKFPYVRIRQLVPQIPADQFANRPVDTFGVSPDGEHRIAHPSVVLLIWFVCGFRDRDHPLSVAL
jgi:hypothetical protein